MDDGRPRSLEHPLPAGMRDLLPEEAAARRQLARRMLEGFARFGYRVVTSPAFELADVIEGGLGPLAASDVLRFIEPDSGEVAVLRPDMTPAIARIVATRLRDRPPPYRIAYEGTVVRRKTSRARKHRQIAQVGVELAGLAEPAGDLEVLALAADALAGVDCTIELADAGIVRALLEGAPADTAEAATRALAKKDEAALADAARGLPYETPLCALPRLAGGRGALEDARTVLAGTPAEGALARLTALFGEVDGLARLRVDVGEVRGFAYYTGSIFSIFAEGAREPVGGGGRYDELFARFGAPMPAIGLGIDLDVLGRALAAPPARDGVVVVGEASDPRVHDLRRRGAAAVAVREIESAREYARAWGFALIWDREAVIRAGDDVVIASALGDDPVGSVLAMLQGAPCRPS